MTATAPAESVVVIDDDHAMRLSCGKIVAKMGLAVESFADGARGLEGVARLRPSLVVLDLKMPGLSGMEVIPRLHEIDPRIIVVVITGYATIDTAVEAMKSGAYDFLPKPFSPDEFRLIVNRGLERRRLAAESARCEVERSLMKRRFVTFVSHQLQTPLVAIHQYLDVLLRTGDNDPVKRREWIDRCLKRTEELQQLIKDWLNVARMEGDTLSRQRVKVDLGEVIRDILATYREMAAAEQLILTAELPSGFAVAGDRNCLNVLFDNLITNAIKYNRPGGSVTISGEFSNGEVAVSVTDTGVGIPAKYREFLFDEFFRVRDDCAKKTPGSGLGLHISRRIAVEMGGTITLESEPGVGSTFRVRLPAWREEA